MLKQRLITAAILLPLFVWAVLAMPLNYFALLLALFVIAGAWEWSALIPLASRGARIGYCALVALGLFASALLLEHILIELGLAVLWWLLALGLVLRYPDLGGWWSVFSKAISGLLLLLPCWSALLYLKIHDNSSGQWLLLLFVLIWSADSGAYFSGRRFGKNKLAPKVSPGKSWEGVIGGAITACIAVFIGLISMQWLQLSALQYTLLALLVLLTVAFSVLGDLFESMAKRLVGVKDSGRLLPGHGGVLDRIDSVTAAAPVFALGLILISGQTSLKVIY